ncbi:DnaJ domain-containing protein [uncultured Parvimonas sp.]|uniref:J domain-containing protein n=1 Tax=uncultured Parvimonas sp. TaxID=747372 RepID=UPI002804E8B7|nr:DnaJ domain-containing protein [uncultured Parvimonas sp.]
MVNYYEILGLEISASLSEITDAIKATRKTARKRSNHPDTKIRHEAEALIEQLAEAEKVFSDEASKSRYDDQLRVFINQNKGNNNSNENTNMDSSRSEEINQFNKVQKYLDRGQIDLARRALTEIRTTNPISMKYKGEISIKLGNITDGIYELDKYIDTDSTNPELYFEVSDILSENGKTKEALQYLFDASQYSSGYSLYSRFGDIYADTKQYDKAIESFNRIDLSSLDQNGSSYINYCLAFCYNRKGSYASGMDYAERSISQNENNYSAIYEKILAYDNLGRLNEVEDLIEKSYINFPNFEPFNYFVLKTRVYKGTFGMTKIRSNNLSILSTFNNLDYIVASQEDLSSAEQLKNNLLPLVNYDETGLVKDELKYLDSQINYAKSTVKNDIGGLKWVFYILIAYLLLFSGISIIFRIVLIGGLVFGYKKLTNIPGYIANKKNNKGRIVKNS